MINQIIGPAPVGWFEGHKIDMLSGSFISRGAAENA